MRSAVVEVDVVKQRRRVVVIMLGSVMVLVRPVEVASGLGSTACGWCFLVALDGRYKICVSWFSSV